MRSHSARFRALYMNGMFGSFLFLLLVIMLASQLKILHSTSTGSSLSSTEEDP